MKVLDLRSDTFTKPNDEMRQKMAAAEVGDDVFGEDPTVNKARLYSFLFYDFSRSSFMGFKIELKVARGSGTNDWQRKGLVRFVRHSK